MSLLDKVVAAVAPPQTEQARREARAKAQAAAGANDWLELVLEHHVRIEDALAGVRSAQEPRARALALRTLSVLLSAHSNAEESVLYPALVRFGHKGHGMAGYTEHAGAKADIGELEYLDPMSQEFLDKLEHIRGAVLHHMYKEESDRFLDLRLLTVQEQDRLTRRFREEFERYMGEGTDVHPRSAPASRTGPSPAAHRQ